MSINDFLRTAIVRAAKLYLKMPIRPFGKNLGILYTSYLHNHKNVKKVIDGITYELDLGEVIDNAMYFSGSREPATSNALRVLCKSGQIVFDIGANIGSHALPMANYVGESGKVYAFEPVPWAIKKFKRNLELNNFFNIKLETTALSDVSEEVEMSFRASFKIGSKSGVGQNGKIDNTWWNECEKIKVRMEPLDSYVVNNQITQVDLIKLDVDGFEGKVIRGALDTLKRFQPIIIMEVAPAWTEMRGDDMKTILQELKQLKYQFFKEDSFQEIENIMELIDSLLPGSGFNIVASVHNLDYK